MAAGIWMKKSLWRHRIRLTLLEIFVTLSLSVPRFEKKSVYLCVCSRFVRATTDSSGLHVSGFRPPSMPRESGERGRLSSHAY